MAKTADALLEGIKTIVTIPASQPLLEDDDFLRIADEQIRDIIVPLIVGCRQDFFVTTSTTVTVANQAAYRIPERALARSLRDLKFYLTSDTGSRRSLAIVSIETEHLFSSAGGVSCYYFKGDKVVLKGTPTDALHTIEWWYEDVPQPLTLLENVATVVSIAGADVTVNAVPAAIIAGVQVDFVRGKPGHTTIGVDTAVSSATSSVITFASAAAIPTDLEAGDYITLRKTSPVIQLPDQAGTLVELLTAKKVLSSISDFEGKKDLEGEIKDAEAALKSVLAPRNRGEQEKIVNTSGLLRGRRYVARRFVG